MREAKNEGGKGHKECVAHRLSVDLMIMHLH